MCADYRFEFSVNCKLLLIRCLLFVVCLFIVCCLLFDACCVLLVGVWVVCGSLPVMRSSLCVV